MFLIVRVLMLLLIMKIVLAARGCCRLREALLRASLVVRCEWTKTAVKSFPAF